MARKRPINETTQKRNKFFPCKGLEKLQRVLIKYENIVAVTKATPLAITGTGNTILMKVVAIITCNPVINTPEAVNRRTCLVNTECNNLTFIGRFKHTK